MFRLNFFYQLFSKPGKTLSQRALQTFILEPILTPSGVIDIGDETLDLGEFEPFSEAIADFDFPVEEMQTEVLEEDLELLSFFAGEELTFAAPNITEPIFESGVFTVGETGEVGVDFLFDGGKYKGELGIFSLEGMEDLDPGSEDFIREAALRATSDSELGYVVISDPEEGARFSGTLGERKDWNSGEYQGLKTVRMQQGDRFALILVPHGTVEDLTENPGLGGSKTPLFSLSTANPDDNLHLGQIADVTGDGSTFVWEDVRTDHHWYDRDFNDLIVQFRGATGEAPYIEEVMDEDLDWRETELGQELIDYALFQQQPSIDEPISDLVFESDSGSQSFDLSEVFVDPTGGELRYELVAGDSDGLQVELDGDRLILTPLEKTGISEVTVKAIDRWGEDVVYTFTVTTNNLNPETIEGVDGALTRLTEEIDSGDLLTGLESEAGENAIAQLEDILEENPELIDFLAKPESLKQLGVDETAVETLQTLLDSPEIGEALGFSDSLGEAFDNSAVWEQYLINAGEALQIVPEDALQTSVGFLDFAGEHGQQVTEVFESVNPRAAYDLVSIENGNWAERLVEFVDGLKESGEDRGIVNLSFDLTQTDAEGRITTRYELTTAEQEAIAYARENNILLVAAAGNTGDRMSALGAASEQFDNIITVGAVNQWEETADYSARGQGLNLVAAGGQWENDPDAFVGTSKATSYVTGAASLVWAANPDLNYQQVKDLLMSTATDLGEEGWDSETGAGLLDVSDAVMMAGLVTPLPLQESEVFEFSEFSGEGRVDPKERAVSDKTEKAIANLSQTQNDLIDQWTVLWLLGNPELTLDELDTEVKAKIETALGTYQQASTEAAKNSSRVEQLTEALTLATSHDRIERERLQAILTRQQDLIALVAQLSEQKAALEQGSTQQKAQIEENIVKAEEAIAQATAKLDYLLIDPQTLLGDPDALRQQATAQLQLGQTYRQQAQGYESDRQSHEAQAQVHDSQSRTWQVVGYTKSRSGSRKEQWGWVTDTEQVKLKNQHQWEAEIAAQNAQTLGQLATQLEQQGQALKEQANLVENNNIDFSQSQGKEDDADRVLELLQQQAETQKELASAYWQQAELLEKRRIQNQRKADWHQEQSRRHEVVGYQKKRSGRKKKIWGWREYPEHIPLAQQAQQLANEAAGEVAALKQLAHQTQQESDRLTQQVERLDTLVNEDWEKIKQGIEYEIIAQQNRLQGEQDLLALTTAKTQQDLAILGLQLNQAETELSDIESDRTTLEQSVSQTEQRLHDTQSEWEKARKELASAQQDLQQFLDTSGHFIPYRERLIAVEKNIEQLELEKVRTEGAISQLQQQFNQDPVGTNSVRLLEDAQEYLEALERDLQWAKVQQDSFSLSALDSPQRLELKALLTELEERQNSNISTNSLPLQQYLDFLQEAEAASTNLLAGFDNLQTRLSKATEEQIKIEEIRDRLQDEYRQLGLEKTNINAFDFIPQLITETETEIQEQQEILGDRQTQIDDAYGIAAQFEKQRQDHQEQVEHWESKINQWEVIRYDRDRSGRKKPVYDWVYHPEAEAQRDVELAAAEIAAQQRDEATLQAQTLETFLQPEMEAIRGKIVALELKHEVLEANQNSPNLEQKISDKEIEIGETLAAIANEQILLATLTDSTAIAQQQEKLSELDRQLNTQQQERGILAEMLAYQKQLLQKKETKLSDKYREIELTESFLKQIEKEADRLQSRLDLINRADELDAQFISEQQQWKEASETQIKAIDELLATREQGKSDRDRLLSLRSQLSQVVGELQQSQTEIQQLKPTVESAQEALALTDLQLGNQELKLQSLNAQDAPLQSAEASFYNLAEQLRQKIWHWDGKKWAYNAETAAEYRQALQSASLMADRRNQLWPQIQDTQARVQELTTQKAQQQTEVQQLESQLTTLENKIPKLEEQVTTLETEIAPIAERIKPLEKLEQQQVTAFQNAATQTQENAGNLAQTTEEQVQALRRLISFGVLASESDIDFFFLEIEPKILDFRDRLQQRSLDFTAQSQQLNQLITSWEQDLTNTTDDVSRQAITAKIEQAQEQVNDLETWKEKNETAVSELENYLNQANDALKSLRLQQELQVRQEMTSNEKRLQSLQAQLQSENAAESALNEDTVLAYADLGDRVREDLEIVAKIWTENLQSGHNKTKELGEQQENLSQSVDDLIAEIENNFADPHGEYHLSENELRDAIATLGTLAPRSDELGRTVKGTKQSIEKILLHVQEDAKLWQKIAPIATRYGLESQEFAEFEQKYQWYQDQDRILAEQYEQERHNYQQQADHWKSQIETWGVVGTRKSGKSRKNVYGWIHNPQAEANYNAAQAKADAAAQKRDVALGSPQSKTYRDEFLNNSGTNGAAIAVLQERTKIGREEYQPLYETAKANIAEREAAIAAGLSQADWYEQQAAMHLAISEKLGPDKQQATWTEQRRVKYRGRSGKTKWKTVTITHVNHDWIVWDNYTKLATDLRKQAAENIKELEGDRYEKERWEPLSNHWSAANDGANQAATPINEARNLFEQLETERESLPQEQAQLNLLQNLLPTLKQQLSTAQQEADTANAKVLQGWLDYDTDAAAYRDAIATIQDRRGELDRQAHQVQNELVAVERWVEGQNVALAEESEAVETLRSQLQERLQEIRDRLPNVTGNELQELQAKEAQLARSYQLLTNKAAVLTEQKTTLTQKRTLLTAQNEVILAEQRLLDAYLVSPDDDFSVLQQQLQQARTALAEAQRLAEQAESNSAAITDPLQATQADLLAKNDAHLTAAKEKQGVLKGLLEATQLNANYTLEAFQKQQELNDLEFHVLQRLQAATIAGNDEAQHLLEVAQYNSLAAAAEIYHRDYRDLASDNGSRCSGGLARPEDRMLADKYYQEWLNYNELKRRAEEQASAFTQVREAAEAEIASLQSQQEAAANRLNELNGAIATTEEEITAKEQELAILEARVTGLERLREQTEQTFIQLLTLEQLNLSQAQLEQQLAQAYQTDIDRAVQERLERDRLEVVRHRLETQAKIEQLRQLQAEENLRLALNQVRSDVGLADVDGTVDAAQLQGQLAGLLSGLQTLGTQQPNLPDDLQALLAETQADLYLALQGDEAKKIEGNLLKVAEGLIEQINQYKAAIAELELEEQQDEALLQQAEQDLQGATLQLLQEIEQSQTLGKEREILTPLNLEVLQKVAYAEQAIEISEDLAKQSKEILEQILEHRKEERKARKKAFWNETLGTIVLVLSIVATIATLGAAAPGIAAATAASLTSLATTLQTISAVISATQAAINGDWAGAIFNVVMAGVGAIPNPSPTLVQLKSLASGLFSSVRAAINGDEIMAFLQVLQGMAGAAFAEMPVELDSTWSYQVLNSLQDVPVMIHTGIQAIEDDDWLGAVNNILNAAVSLAQNFSNTITSSETFKDVSELLSDVKLFGNVGLSVAGALQEDSLDGWLRGIDGVLSSWSTYSSEQYELELQTKRRKASENYGVPLENVRATPNGEIYVDNIWMTSSGELHLLGADGNTYIAGFTPQEEPDSEPVEEDVNIDDSDAQNNTKAEEDIQESEVQKIGLFNPASGQVDYYDISSLPQGDSEISKRFVLSFKEKQNSLDENLSEIGEHKQYTSIFFPIVMHDAIVQNENESELRSKIKSKKEDDSDDDTEWLEYIPYIGDLLTLEKISDHIDEGNYKDAAIETLFLIPGADLFKLFKKSSKKGDDLLESLPNSNLPRIPGRVQSRINVANGQTRFTPSKSNGEKVDAGLEHVRKRHFGKANTQSQFTIGEDKLKSLLQRPDVVSSPIIRVFGKGDNAQYVRMVDTKTIVGTVRKADGGGKTTHIKILTDRAGNLITTFPVPSP